MDFKQNPSPLEKACPETRLYLFLRTRTFVGIQSPVPKFEGNNKENKGNQNQTTDIKESVFVLQEIAGRIVGCKGKGDDKANQPTKKRIVYGNRILGKIIEHIENVDHSS